MTTPNFTRQQEHTTCPAALSVNAHLHLEDTAIFYGGHQALRETTLSIPRKLIFSIIGPSGCGKSSMLRAMNRLNDRIEGCAVRGRVVLNGEDIYTAGTNLIQLRRRVGMIFQQPNPFPLSIENNIDLPLREHGWHSRSKRRERIEKVIREVGLWNEVKDRLRQSAFRLSGGQQQRLCVARALALDPEVLLMDEPCSALDPLSSAVVEDLIVGLRDRLTVVVVTHNLGQARRISDYTAFFWSRDHMGCLVECGETERLFTAPVRDLTAAYVNGQRG